MKNVNTKRKTESDIRIFKDCLPTVGELRNPEDIGVEMNMHTGRFFFSSCRLLRTMKIKQLLQFPSVITLSSQRNVTNNNSVHQAVIMLLLFG